MLHPTAWHRFPLNPWVCLFIALHVGDGPDCVAGEVRVAVASNFVGAAQLVGERFERGSGHTVVLVPGSTGKQYAQIVNGAPFDVWLAADAERPERLEREGRTVAGSRFTYALGKLVLAGSKDSRSLVAGRYRRLAIAKPAVAPYGAAAREVMRNLGVWERDQGKLVRGESVGQAWQFVKTGNAELGFVSASQLGGAEAWTVPEHLYTPITQQAVLLTESEAAQQFVVYLKGDEALKIILKYGYGIPACSKNPTSLPSGSP